MSIGQRLQRARLIGLLILAALIATAFLRDNPAQPWVAVAAVVALLGLRYLWRCPHCKMPLSAFPAPMAECKRCGEAL